MGTMESLEDEGNDPMKFTQKLMVIDTETFWNSD